MKVPICEVDIYIVAGSRLEVKKLDTKKSRAYDGSGKRRNMVKYFIQIKYLNVNFYSASLILYSFPI